MRRLVGISARSAVAMALPLMGAMYVAAEATQALRRQSEGAVNARNSIIAQTPLARTTRSLSPIKSGSTKSDPRQDEVAAEQQASAIPPEKLSKQATKDPHTRQIVISIPDRRLALIEDGALVKVYPIAVGASETPSPYGNFTLINRAIDPTYRHEGKEIAPGKNNPLGTRWMGLSLKGYGIHGTNVQSSVGKAASHGCFRMKKKDVEELYSLVKVGDAVTVRGERDELTASLFTTNTNTGLAMAASNAETQISTSSN
jgi:lipoprotein-anchoring transpeptidase ErfK/SrfK